MSTQVTAWQGVSRSVEHTLAIGGAIAGCARAGDVIALVGELGAGKTQLVRGLAAGLGLDPSSVSSPTFVMVQEYEPAGSGPALVHVDAYRLHSLDDFESIGWQSGPGPGSDMADHAVVAVEWADRVAGMLGDDLLTVTLTHQDDNHRGVCIEAAGTWAARLPGLIESLQRITG